MNELTISKELAGLEKSKAKQIEAVFAPMVKMLKEFEATYDEIAALEINPDTCKKAKRLRLDIAKVRIDADKVRKEQKEEYLRAGNAIQGVYNILKFAVADKEEKLKDIETHYERIEAEKKSRLQAERQAELLKYNAEFLIEFTDLCNMSEGVWINFLASAKAQHEALVAAEIKAESDRLEAERKAAEEREKIWLENERLKKEAAEAAKVKAEIAKKAEEERQVQEAKIREEREARAKLEREIAEEKAETSREEAEAVRRQADEMAREYKAKEKERLAPDKEKLTIIATDVLAKIGTVTSTAAKEAIQAAHDIILNTAERM